MNRLDGLDALRGIAAACVLLYHVAANTVGEGASNAYLAVDFFFMLSGYVMARTYEVRLENGLSPLRFFALRYARLWSVMAISMLIGIPFAIHIYGPNPSTFIAIALNLLLLPSFLGGYAFTLNFAAWSIFFELAANLFHGLIVWRVRTKLLPISVAILILIFLIHGVDQSGPLRAGMDIGNFAAGFRRVLLSYLLGVWLYRLWGDFPPISPPKIVTVGAMPFIFMSTWLASYNPGYLDLLFVVAYCPLMIAGGLKLESSALFRWLGKLSFPLYAVHTPIISLLVMNNFSAVLAIPLSLIAAVIVQHALEPTKRIQRWVFLGIPKN